MRSRAGGLVLQWGFVTARQPARVPVAFAVIHSGSPKISDAATHGFSDSPIPIPDSRASPQLDAIEGHVRIHLGVVIHVVTLEAEQLEELVLVAGVIGEGEQVLGGDLRP